MTERDRTQDDACAILRRLLDAIGSGELEASLPVRAGMVGALSALGERGPVNLDVQSTDV